MGNSISYNKHKQRNDGLIYGSVALVVAAGIAYLIYYLLLPAPILYGCSMPDPKDKDQSGCVPLSKDKGGIYKNITDCKCWTCPTGDDVRNENCAFSTTGGTKAFKTDCGNQACYKWGCTE